MANALTENAVSAIAMSSLIVFFMIAISKVNDSNQSVALFMPCLIYPSVTSG
jgi:hypothetical protein